MATKAIMEFKRGTGVTHFFNLPIANYSPTATLFFTAKPAIDNDNVDAAAVINKGFTVANIITDPTIASYSLVFDPVDLIGVTFANGADEIDYIGEFKYIVPGSDPVTFPADNNYILVKIYANVKLATS